MTMGGPSGRRVRARGAGGASRYYLRHRHAAAGGPVPVGFSPYPSRSCCCCCSSARIWSSKSLRCSARWRSCSIRLSSTRCLINKQVEARGRHAKATYGRDVGHISTQPCGLRLYEVSICQREIHASWQRTESARSKNAGGDCFLSSVGGRLSVGEVDGWGTAAMSVKCL